MAFVIHITSLSSPLLPRISPSTFAFISIPTMCLSSLNSSNSKAFRHIIPNSAQVCEGMIYSKTGVPWQIKSTLIIVLFLLVLPRNALFLICSPYGRQWKYPKIYHMRSIFLCLGNSIVRS